LRAIAQAEKPILIHCWHGSDRTGVVAAMYRMVFQNWPREQAIDEFVNGGFGYHASFYPNIERYLKRVDIEAIRRQVVGKVVGETD
jgi:protein tyrosine/serine phosphatase